jgi:hypothetical protein
MYFATLTQAQEQDQHSRIILHDDTRVFEPVHLQLDLVLDAFVEEALIIVEWAGNDLHSARWKINQRLSIHYISLQPTQHDGTENDLGQLSDTERITVSSVPVIASWLEQISHS